MESNRRNKTTVSGLDTYLPRMLALLLIGLTLSLTSLLIPQEEWKQLIETNLYAHSEHAAFLLFAFYVAGVLLMAPLSPFALVSGLLFGFWFGTLISVLSINVGANTAFLIARNLRRDSINKFLIRNRHMKYFFNAFLNKNMKIIILMRLNPIMPFNLQNYAYGLTDIKLVPYAISTLIGSAPFTLALVYLGHVGRNIIFPTGESKNWTLILISIGILLLIPSIAHTKKISNRKKRKPNES